MAEAAAAAAAATEVAVVTAAAAAVCTGVVAAAAVEAPAGAQLLMQMLSCQHLCPKGHCQHKSSQRAVGRRNQTLC
jgi:hypothetical protein